jgi:hypothetical protein
MRRRRAVALVVAVVVGWNLVALGLDRTGGRPGGPRSSTYATAPEGLAAYADLLRRAGHPVVRLRATPREAALDPAATVVLLDPPALAAADVEALRRFVDGGGRLVAGGADSNDWLDGLLDDDPVWDTVGVRRAAPIAPVPEVDGIADVRSAGEGSWRETGEALPVLAGDAGVLVAVATPGLGRLVLVADASPLQNRLLPTADNAALGMVIAGESGRAIVFVESVHGYGEATGFAAIPTRWRWALGGLAVAALLLLLARGRRLGPPEREARALPPPRRHYVEALAATLAKTKHPAAAVAPVQQSARERLARVAGDSADRALESTAERLGLSKEEIRAVLGPVHDDPGLLAAGRALARLEGGGKVMTADGGDR